jgi:hypothetical protein
MVKLNVNKNVKLRANNQVGGWEEALKDAEGAIQKTNRELADWKATAAICRKMIAKGQPWPGSQSPIPKQTQSESVIIKV